MSNHKLDQNSLSANQTHRSGIWYAIAAYAAWGLLCFAQGAKRIPLATIGFLQYLAPTISLGLGIFVFKESFSAAHFVSFGFIWSALLLYSCANTKLLQKLQPALFKSAQTNER